MSDGEPQHGSGWPPGEMKWVSEEQVQQVLTWDRLLPAVTRALQSISMGPNNLQGAVQPLRSRIKVPQSQEVILTMPGLVTGHSLAVKVLTYYPSNSSRGLPIRTSTILLLDVDTGLPAAVLPGHTITEMRTAAASAIATLQILKGKDKMREKEDKLVVAVLGAGAQARSHARVMAHVLNVDKIMVWARRTEAAEALCQVLRSESIPAAAATTVQQAVAAADIINCCTRTTTPLLQACWVKPGAHINSIGAPSPYERELEKDLVRSAIIYTDSYEAAVKESGDIIAAGAEVYAEIGEVLLGTKPVLADKITIFKSLGLAVEDAVSAQLVYDTLSTEEKE